MNNEHRDNFEEQKLAEETLRVLDGGPCETDQDSRTFELGRLLKQSASHGLPASNDELRESLLAELEGEASVSLAPAKDAQPKPTDRVGRKRMWMSLATGTLVAVGGWWLYTGGLEGVNSNMAFEPSLVDRAPTGESGQKEFKKRKITQPAGEPPVFGPGAQAGNGQPFGDAPGSMNELKDSKKQNAALPPAEQQMDALPQQPYFQDQDIDVFDGDPKDGAINIGGVYNSNAGKPLSSRHVEGQQRGEQAGQNGVTLDLPRLEATPKSTVVSVPDGGTALGWSYQAGNKRTGRWQKDAACDSTTFRR